MVLLISVLLLLAVSVFYIYKWLTANWNVFKDRGVPYEKPIILLGNTYDMISKSFLKGFTDFYLRNKTHKIVGFFHLRDAIFVVNDPELVKKITVKDFDDFPNHYPSFGRNQDPLIDAMLSSMLDQRWKNMRYTLTPVFTASKMRIMFTLMDECFGENLDFLREKVANGEDVELKDCFTRLSNDLIASTAFGLKINSYKDRDNKFYKIGQSITNFRGRQLLKFVFYNTAPKLANQLGIRLFSKEKTNYFKSLVIDSMKQRREKNIVRPDMIHLLMEAKEQSPHNWSDDEILAQCFIFFFAAFENNANLLAFTCHELMDNPDIQERLHEEVIETYNHLNGAPLDYDAVNKMKYMDMVISETMRKWTFAFILDRVCSNDYTLTDEDDNVIFEFKKEDRIFVPVAGFHADEEYFEHPERFDPERFSDENKDKIKPFTYLPFGVGPRSCIGNRYALMQAKAMLYFLSKEFKMERCSKTVDNLLDDVHGFQLTPKSGFWMRFVKRT